MNEIIDEMKRITEEREKAIRELRELLDSLQTPQQRGAIRAQKATQEMEAAYDERTKDIPRKRRVPRNHKESFELYGFCMLPKCKCFMRPTFSRHRF